jgi:Rad3-related DNA helicase
MLARHQAIKGELIVCTHAFFVTNMLYVKQFRQTPPYCVVIDEAHRIADSVRYCLTYMISDYLLRRAVKALSKISWECAKDLAELLKLMIRIARLKPTEPIELLSDYEIMKLIEKLESIDSRGIEIATRIAIQKGILDPVKDRKTLKTIETIIRDIKRWIKELYYALPEENRKPENYVYMSLSKRKTKRKKIRCGLVICHFYVSPVIKTRILPLIKRVHGCSATIINKQEFAIETAMDFPLIQIPPIFSIENTRIYLPTDTPNLARKCQKPGDLERAMEMIGDACKQFLKEGFRSLVVMPAERERELFLKMFSELKIMTYGEMIKAREAAEFFREGEGDVLVGTLAHYAEGIDLPRNIAPIIFNLRPDYPKPQSPEAQFEERRWGKERWGLWRWRVSRTALQVRGRNQRTGEDIGLCFFISQQFRRCLKLPEWLQPAVVEDKSFKECVEEGISLLKKRIP